VPGDVSVGKLGKFQDVGREQVEVLPDDLDLAIGECRWASHTSSSSGVRVMLSDSSTGGGFFLDAASPASDEDTPASSVPQSHGGLIDRVDLAVPGEVFRSRHIVADGDVLEIVDAGLQVGRNPGVGPEFLRLRAWRR